MAIFLPMTSRHRNIRARLGNLRAEAAALSAVAKAAGET